MRPEDIETVAIAMFEAGVAFISDAPTNWAWEDAEQDGMRAEARAAIAACAAGPWRYDVENAPCGEWLITMDDDGTWHKKRRALDWDGQPGCWFDTDLQPTHTPFAFATINPPENTP